MALKNYAVISDGVVQNVVVWDPNMADNWIQSDTASIGDLWDGQKFTRPKPAPTPEPETPLDVKILQALIEKGIITEADIEKVKG